MRTVISTQLPAFILARDFRLLYLVNRRPDTLPSPPARPRTTVSLRPLHDASLAFLSSQDEGPFIPRATVLPRPLEDFEVPAKGGSAASALPPGATIVSRPLESAQVPASSSEVASPEIPGTAVIPRPLENLEVSPPRGLAAGSVVPTAAVCPRPPERAQVPLPSRHSTDKRGERTAPVLRPLQDGQVARFRCPAIRRNAQDAAVLDRPSEHVQVSPLRCLVTGSVVPPAVALPRAPERRQVPQACDRGAYLFPIGQPALKAVEHLGGGRVLGRPAGDRRAPPPSLPPKPRDGREEEKLLRADEVHQRAHDVLVGAERTSSIARRHRVLSAEETPNGLSVAPWGSMSRKFGSDSSCVLCIPVGYLSYTKYTTTTDVFFLQVEESDDRIKNR